MPYTDIIYDKNKLSNWYNFYKNSIKNDFGLEFSKKIPEEKVPIKNNNMQKIC